MKRTLGIAFSVVLASTRSAEAQPGWQLRDADSAPGPRNGVALAFDRVGARTILFGGADNSGVNLGDTWAWNGSVWSLVTSSGPSARSHLPISYDEVRGVLVLYGGRCGSDQISTETWEFDCATSVWSQKSPLNTPGPRYVHMMAYDVRRGVTLLFGGLRTPVENDLAPNDTWSWDGSDWTQVAGEDSGPERRQAGAMAYDRERAVTVLFGGQAAGQQVSSDTWEWMGDRWILRTSPIAPLARSYGGMVYGWADRQCILFGGYAPGPSPNYFGDTSTWAGAKWSLRTLTASPAIVTGFGFAYDSYRHVAVLYGGNDTAANASDQTWELTMPPPCTADYNGDGFIDGIDYDQFNNDFEAGCP